MDHGASDVRRVLRRLTKIAAWFVVLGVLCVAAAAIVPISAMGGADPLVGRGVRPIPEHTLDLQPLLARVARRELIRPASLQAAVKDDGTAQRLLKALKLQGVIEMDGQLVAYIHVEKQGVQTVRAGEQVLDFVVERIDPGSVTLSLQGVQAKLGH